jgi:hypothetical protein
MQKRLTAEAQRKQVEMRLNRKGRKERKEKPLIRLSSLRTLRPLRFKDFSSQRLCASAVR